MSESTERAQHTPEPWVPMRFTDDEDTRWMVCVDGPRAYHIATVENGAPGDTLETEGANARLIAAAPDLLEACRAVLEWSVAEENHTGDLWSRVALWEGARDKCRAAIAKAEGRDHA